MAAGAGRRECFVSDYRLIKAPCWNNGKPNEPGNKAYWILYSSEVFPNEPVIFEHLPNVVDYIIAREDRIAGTIEPPLTKTGAQE
jgi:hypothetical protein